MSGGSVLSCFTPGASPQPTGRRRLQCVWHCPLLGGNRTPCRNYPQSGATASARDSPAPRARSLCPLGQAAVAGTRIEFCLWILWIQQEQDLLLRLLTSHTPCLPTGQIPAGICLGCQQGAAAAGPPAHLPHPSSFVCFFFYLFMPDLLGFQRWRCFFGARVGEDGRAEQLHGASQRLPAAELSPCQTSGLLQAPTGTAGAVQARPGIPRTAGSARLLLPKVREDIERLSPGFMLSSLPPA